MLVVRKGEVRKSAAKVWENDGRRRDAAKIFGKHFERTT
jgi:hypothetical protein